MSVTEESGGRLNTYAKEPKMELVNEGTDRSSLVLIIVGVLLVIGLIAFSFRIS